MSNHIKQLRHELNADFFITKSTKIVIKVGKWFGNKQIACVSLSVEGHPVVYTTYTRPITRAGKWEFRDVVIP